MGFNPFREKGIPIEQQFSGWSDINVQPYDKGSVHPYTRARVILMNGIETEAVIFGHQFQRHSDDNELKKKLALTRRIEQQQQKMVNWLLPADESALEVTLGYEQVAVDLTSCLARMESDPYVKAALDFALIEDFDHLYRYANLYQLTENKRAADIVGDLTEVMPGRPTKMEHRHPFDTLRRHYSRGSADIGTKLHVATITAGEQQTMNFYMNAGNRFENHLGRGLYQEIAQIEEEHVTHYGSLADPAASWFDMLLLHEYNECYLYYSCMSSETDDRIKRLWQRCLEEEISHLHAAVEIIRQYEKRDPVEQYPDSFPELTVFHENREYVRDILASQVELTEKDLDYAKRPKLPRDDRYFRFQEMVNRNGIPSEQVIEENMRRHGRDYRSEVLGVHPVEWLRARQVSRA